MTDSGSSRRGDDGLDAPELSSVDAPISRGALRVTFRGVLAMVLTAYVGALLGGASVG